MKYLVYQITNNTNGKIYIGCHKTDDVNDGYMGSGKLLTRAIKKYGVENFSKEILHIFDSAEEMFDKEAELVNESFVSSPVTYNVKAGGSGGFDYINGNGLSVRHFTKENAKSYSIKANQKKKDLWETDPLWRETYRATKSEAIRQAFKNGFEGGFKDKKHTAETRRRMSELARARLKDPTKNSQYGTCWITNGIENKKIKKDLLDQYLQEGWSRGRS